MRRLTSSRRSVELAADVQGVTSYGLAPAPLEKTRDMIEEVIEDPLDAIHYQIRQVARLQDLPERISAANIAEKGE